MLESILLGLFQGLTEFIPVSSSGHLVIGQHLFYGNSSHLFLEWINIGTFLALLVYFRRRISRIATDLVRTHDYRMAVNILLTAAPAGIVGFFASDFIASTYFFGSIWVVIAMLTSVGMVMVLLERFPKLPPVAGGAELTPLRALAIGAFQVASLVPGVSRSGSTIIAGRLMGLAPEKAAEYSFLASLPIMAGVTLKLILGSEERGYFVANLGPLLAGNIVAFVAGLVAVGFLMRYLGTHSLALFGWYRIALAAIVALLLLVQ